MKEKKPKQLSTSNPQKKIVNTFNKQIMKTQNNTFFQTLGKAQLDNLVKEVKETVATGIPHVNQKTAFGVVDLWNLERSRRSRMVRRHLA
jgi:protein-arginine kinase